MKNISLILCLIILLGCGKSNDKNITVDAGFTEYVEAFTSYVVSNQSNIKIVLTSDLSQGQMDKVNGRNLFDFEPEIEGTTEWVDNRTVVFKPSQLLPNGVRYAVEFALGEVISVSSEFEDFEFSFQVMPQFLEVDFDNILTPSLKKPNAIAFNGVVHYADFADPDLLEKAFSFDHNGNNVKVNWQHASDARQSKFTVTPIKKRKAETTLNVSWEGEELYLASDGNKSFDIPARDIFEVYSARWVDEKEAYFSIVFTEPLDTKQNAFGLVHLENGTKLKLVLNGNEIKAYPKQGITGDVALKIDRPIRNWEGDELKAPYRKTFNVRSLLPAIELMGNGNIIPSSGDVLFPFKAVNLSAVHVRIFQVYENNVMQFLQVNNLDGKRELRRVARIVYDEDVALTTKNAINYSSWNEFSINLTSLMEAEPGAIYRVQLSLKPQHSLYACGSDVDLPAQNTLKDASSFNSFNGSDYYDYYDEWNYENYSWGDRDNPCKVSYYINHKRIKNRNVIASNIGLTASGSKGNAYQVVATDLLTAEPISGATIEFINYQNQVQATAKTNGDGVAKYTGDALPFLAVAKHKGQFNYLKLSDSDALSTSLYAVGGQKTKKGIKAYLYGERGVWRPGDSVYLSMLLEDKLQNLPNNYPVKFEVQDPNGRVAVKKVISNNVEGLYDLRFKTNASDITGNWLAKAEIGNQTFSKRLKIETVKPNRIKVDLDLTDGFISKAKQSVNMKATWMHGAKAANLQAKVDLIISPMKTQFEKYEGYQFDDRSVEFYKQEKEVLSGRTDANGNASIPIKWRRPNELPGMLKMQFRSRVFEGGGNFSTEVQSAKYSPFENYIGIKTQNGNTWSNGMDTEKEQTISIACVNQQGQAASSGGLVMELYKISWNWWYENRNRGNEYVGRYSKDKVLTQNIAPIKGEERVKFKFPKRTWGRMLLRIKDLASGHSSSKIIYVDYSGWRNFDNTSDAASMLTLSAQKEEVAPEDEVEINIPSSGQGKILIQIEKGDKILKTEWIDAEESSTTYSFEATPEMAPNVYVHAIYLQPTAQQQNDLPVRMYGIQPISVVDPNTRLEPQIEAPETIEPNQEYTITVSEKEDKRMAYTLVVVDEGLLSLTQFKTPKPWNHFYAKEALGVNTWDLYKYVLNVHASQMSNQLALGGDQALIYKEDASANRFKPVVSFLGPFYLKSGEQKHQLKMPNYIGKVRVMVVSGYGGAYGSAEKYCTVKQPLMLLATMPRVLGPSEELQLPVSVFAMDDAVKNITVKVETDDLLSTPIATKTIRFDEQGDKLVNFDLTVARRLGVTKVRVTAVSGNFKASETVEVPIRIPNPQIDKTERAAVDKGESVNLDYETLGIQGTNFGYVELSRLPELALNKYLNYLLRYPHGCVEQTTSSVFPQLYLASLVELNDQKKAGIKTNVQAGIDRLRSFQVSGGGLSYWPGHGRGGWDGISEWGTNYAGHFILEAKKQGYAVDGDFLDHWISFQQKASAEWSRYQYSGYGRYGGDLTQAYRLYTLALAGEPDIGAMNRLLKDSKLSDAGAWRLATAYFMIGQDKTAQKLIQSRNSTVEKYRATGYTYGSSLRDQAMILETLTFAKKRNEGYKLLMDIAAQLDGSWHSTQTTAYALMAISKFAGTKEGDEIKATVTINGKTTDFSSDKLVVQQLIDIDKGPKTGSVAIQNNGTTTLFAKVYTVGKPVEYNAAPTSDNIRMSIRYEDAAGKSMSDITSLKQGTDFTAVVKITHPGVLRNYQELALTQIFPSGFEIRNERLEGTAAKGKGYDYQDIRDDRVMTYFDLNRSESKTFKIKLTATYAGRYYWPAVDCQAMYDNEIQAVQPGKWIEVESTK